MRSIASSVEPKQNLDRLFGNITQEEVLKTLSDQIDEQWKKKYNNLKDQIDDEWKKQKEQWKKKYNELKAKRIVQSVLIAVIVVFVLSYSLSIVYAYMP